MSSHGDALIKNVRARELPHRRFFMLPTRWTSTVSHRETGFHSPRGTEPFNPARNSNRRIAEYLKRDCPGARYDGGNSHENGLVHS